ncbi:MAG: alpha/beta hydrolase [Bacteroidota bacterium]
MSKLVMNQLSMLFFLVLFCLVSACEKEEVTPNTPGPTPGTRYLDLLFSEVDSTIGVQYGANTNQAGSNVPLLMNIYQPANDTENNRPLIVLAHGGGFAEGDREDFNDLARKFARAGYVAASISYRLMGGADDPSLQIAVIDAVQDMKAAVRFFNLDNTYRIDPDNIFIGGFSAGAVTALHYAYFDEAEISAVPEELQQYILSTGGLSGNSGNPGGSEQIKGVINISGGLLKADLVDAGDPILYSIHGSLDNCTIDPDSENNPNGDFIEGSCLIHPILDSFGITNQLRLIEGGDHGAYFSCADCDDEMRRFIFDNL